MPYQLQVNLLMNSKTRMEQSLLIRNLQTNLQEHLPQHLDLLRQMVNINSFTSNPAGVNELGKMTAETFSKLGFEAEFVQAADFIYGQHLVLTRPARSVNGRGAPKIGLISHLDTVYPAAEEWENDFSWRISGKRIYGPGVYDIKGGTVMIYMMLAALQAEAPAFFDSVSWVVLLNAAEEALVPDFGHLILEHLSGETLASLVFEGGEAAHVEPGEYRLVVARKGMARYHIRVEGKAAHAGTAHALGANAILQMADVVKRISSLTDYEKDLTINVGTIAGGTVINRVPHQASASMEMRAFSPATFAATSEKITALNGFSSVRSANDGYPCQVHVDVLGEWGPWASNEKSKALMALWQETGRELGLRILPQERGGLSDGNWTWYDIPTVDGLGPDGGNAHCSERSDDGSKDQEYILPGSYVPKALMNILGIMRLVRQWTGGSEQVPSEDRLSI
jgi:glutamate carboxypeptidase